MSGCTPAEGGHDEAACGSAPLVEFAECAIAERNQMLQRVLAERFHLVAQTVSKDLPGYTLTVAKSGFKLKPLYSLACKDALVYSASTVTDKTGISGFYRFDLQWDIARPAHAYPEQVPSLLVSQPYRLRLKRRSASS